MVDSTQDETLQALWKSDSFLYPDSALTRPMVSCSACLAGQPVRYDGGHKHQPLLTSFLAKRLQLLLLCPEAEAGLGTPRPPMQLEKTPQGLLLRELDEPRNEHSAAVNTWAITTIDALQHSSPLCGVITKARSPSCGFQSAAIISSVEESAGTGVTTQELSGDGLFIRQLRRAFPWLPIIDEEALHDQSAGLVFNWQCNVVFDWCFASTTADDQALQRHYQGVLKKLSRYPGDESGRFVWQNEHSQRQGKAALKQYLDFISTHYPQALRNYCEDQALPAESS